MPHKYYLRPFGWFWFRVPYSIYVLAKHFWWIDKRWSLNSSGLIKSWAAHCPQELEKNMSALDEVLEAYRDMFGVKSDRANEIHRLACIEVSELRSRSTQDAPDRLWRRWARRIAKFFMQHGYKSYRKLGGR